MRVSADFAKLREMRARLVRLPHVQEAVADKAAPAVTDLAGQAFDAGRSVYGEAYAPNKDGSTRTLRRTGNLRAQVRFVRLGTKIRCVLGVKYAKYHIKNGILPRGGAALPTTWTATIKRLAGSELEQHMRVR